MNTVVLDSGIFIVPVFPEDLTFLARSLIDGLRSQDMTFHAPVLLRYEMTAVAPKVVY
ncbi:MAG: hypothetical protein OHK0046_30480 [Anaerolineae bacterium]